MAQLAACKSYNLKVVSSSLTGRMVLLLESLISIDSRALVEGWHISKSTFIVYFAWPHSSVG